MFPVARVRGPAVAVALSHFAAVIGAIVLIRPGRDTSREVSSRIGHIHDHADGWALAWMLFVLAAFAMIWLVVALRRRADPEGHDARLQGAVLFTVLGAAIESIGHCLTAALPLVTRDGFPVLTRAADLMTGVVAALAFGIGILLALRSLHRHLRGGSLGVGYANVCASAAMALATLFRAHDFAAFASLIVLATVILFACALLVDPWSRSETLSEP